MLHVAVAGGRLDPKERHQTALAGLELHPRRLHYELEAAVRVLHDRLALVLLIRKALDQETHRVQLQAALLDVLGCIDLVVAAVMQPGIVQLVPAMCYTAPRG